MMKNEAFDTFSASVNFKKRKSEKISDFLKAKKYYAKSGASIMIMVCEY